MRRTIATALLATILAGCAPTEAPDHEASRSSSHASTSSQMQTSASVEATEEVTGSTKKIKLMESIKLTGSGDDVLPVDVPSDRPVLLTISGNANESHFAVRTHGPKGSALLVNTTEKYSGTHLDEINGIDEIEVNASDSWSITISDWVTISAAAVGEKHSGNGDDVIFITERDYAKPAQVKIEGNSSQNHFAVIEYVLSPDDGWTREGLLVNTTDTYSGRVRMGYGNILQVTATGPWSLEITQ